MKLLLDTNAYTALMRGEASVASRVREAEIVLMSAVVVGELIYGFHHGSRYASNIQQLDAFLDSAYVQFLPVRRETADRFGHIAESLRRKGRPIPSNDVWIAAHTQECNAELLSFDSHFSEVDGIVWRHPDA
jgi:predicted nucleic acid-binding protein